MGHPSTGEWAVWNRAIHMAFNLDSQKRLLTKLGAWKKSMNTLHRWYYTSDDQQLWHHTRSGWHVHAKIPNKSRMARFHSHYQESMNGLDAEQCLCITIMKGYHHILMQSRGLMKSSNLAGGPVTSWQQFQDSEFCRDWKWEVTVVGEVKEIVAAIQDGTALAVSNGLYKEG